MKAYNNNIEADIFSLANEQYEEIVSDLVSQDMQTKDHGEIETYLKT